MRRCHSLVVLALCISSGVDTNAQSKKSETATPIKANINVSSVRPPISKYMYGMFLEHLGNVDVGDLVDDGLWSELLDDRKFYYPVDHLEKQVPPNNRDTTNQWYPLDESVILMDSMRSYVGAHSPRVMLKGNGTAGIAQQGLEVVPKKYTGRIVLAGSPGVAVEVSLKWGDGDEEKSAFRIDKLTDDFRKYEFVLECKTKSKNARVEVTGKGQGSFSIGAISIMPADNISGFRSDVVKLLRELNSGLYRWGGNMSSGYDWRDGVGDPDKRPPRYEYAWNALENNDVGSHELVKLAELINVELSLSVNAGFGDAHSAGEWVEYMNGSKESKMGKLRVQNGHPEPFGIKLWCIGNEMYGFWQLGHTDLKSYVIKHNMFAEKMKQADPTIKLIGSGATPEEMTITENAKRITGKVQAEFGSAADWTGGLLAQAQKNIDYMSEHFYCSVTDRFDVDSGKYVRIDEPFEDWTRRPANRVKLKAEAYAEYHKTVPGSARVKVYMDEWAYYTNWVHPHPTLGVTIGYGRALHEMFRHTDLFAMSGFTFGTSCLSFTKNEADYNSAGLLFKLYQSQFGSLPVEVSGSSTQPEPKFKVGGDQPSVNAGGDTYPLDVIAALTEDRKVLTLSIINPTEKEQVITLGFVGGKIQGKVKRYTLGGSSINARNIVGKKPQVILQEHTLKPLSALVVAPATINIYRYELQ